MIIPISLFRPVVNTLEQILNFSFETIEKTLIQSANCWLEVIVTTFFLYPIVISSIITQTSKVTFFPKCSSANSRKVSKMTEKSGQISPSAAPFRPLGCSSAGRKIDEAAFGAGSDRRVSGRRVGGRCVYLRRVVVHGS